MSERRAQMILLVRAFEEADREGALLTHQARAAATRRALSVAGLIDLNGDLAEAENIRNGETVTRRARLLFDSLHRRIPALHRILHLAQLGMSTTPAMVGAAFLVGLLTNGFGLGREINLLSFPLLGILAWNLVLYAFFGWGLVRPWFSTRKRPRLGHGGLAARLSGRFFEGALWRRLHGRSIAQSRTASERRIAAKALVRFGALWHRHAGELLAARVRRLLHLGAIALVAGVVVGMYLRGLVLEYRVRWESTFLDAETVQTFLGFVLGPAAAVLGARLPDVAGLTGIEGGKAALWIHLYAMTAMLFVGLPRTGFVLWEGWCCKRLTRDVPVDMNDGYFQRIFSEWRGATKQVEVLPYSFSPNPSAAAALRALLHDFFGARADIRLVEPMAYGDDPPTGPASGSAYPDDLVSDRDRQSCIAVVFNLAQSPEIEVHGRLLEELKSRMTEEHGQLLVFLDSSDYRRRLPPQRLEERLRAWRRITRQVGLGDVELNLEQPIDDKTLAAVGAALWPAETEVDGAEEG